MDQLRKPKIFDMWIFDWVTALLGGYLIAVYIFNINEFQYIILAEFGFILFGIVVHKLFGVDTMLGYYLGINQKPFRA